MKRIKLLITVSHYYPTFKSTYRGSTRILAPTIFVYNNHSCSQYFLVKENDYIKIFKNSFSMSSFSRTLKYKKEKINTYPIIGGYLELTKSVKELLNKNQLEVIDEYLLGEVLIKKAHYYGNINKILEYVGTEDEYRSQSKS